jgi:L-rhamnose-H+ transport protein
MGMVVFPWLAVWLTIPNAWSVFEAAGFRVLLLMVLFGVGFGLAQIFFGLGIAAIGIALNFAIAIGLATALGSLVPLLVLQRQKIFTPQGHMIFLGVALAIAGIVGCAAAGGMKEKQLAAAGAGPKESTAVKMSFRLGVFLCILAGIGSPFNNFGLAFGKPLLNAAIAQGVGPGSQANVIWAPLNTAALIPYLIYCAYLWKKNGSAHLGPAEIGSLAPLWACSGLEARSFMAASRRAFPIWDRFWVGLFLCRPLSSRRTCGDL